MALVYAWAVLRVMMVGAAPTAPMHPLRGGFYRIRVTGWENVAAAERERALIVFNHPSYTDAAAMAWLFAAGGISKAGVANMPFIGLFARALQVSRGWQGRTPQPARLHAIAVLTYA